MPYDVRALANFVIDRAEEDDLKISNIQINKILYFLYADYLVAFNRKLTTAKIEAWDYGPVFRELYHAFKSHGPNPITTRAYCTNPHTGRSEIASCILAGDDEIFIKRYLQKYIRMSARSLVDQSHIEGGPWDKTWNHSEQANPTMKISDDLIRDWHNKAMKH